MLLGFIGDSGPRVYEFAFERDGVRMHIQEFATFGEAKQNAISRLVVPMGYDCVIRLRGTDLVWGVYAGDVCAYENLSNIKEFYARRRKQEQEQESGHWPKEGF